MNQDDLLLTILKSNALPTLPLVATKLVEITTRPDVTMGEISTLISRDTALAAKILKIANSAFYSFPNRISTISQAVSILGISAVRNLALSFTILSIKADDENDRFDYRVFWEKSLAAAVTAKLITEQEESPGDPEEFFIASLLQNFGELILARVFPSEYGRVLEEVENSNRPVEEVEREILQIDHTTVGYEVALSWNFPLILVEPIRYHHAPQAFPEGDPKIKHAIGVAHLAGLLAAIPYAPNPQVFHQKFIEQGKKLLRLDQYALDRVQQKMHIELAEIADFFDMQIDSPKSIEDVLMEANAALSILNMGYDQMNKELIKAKVMQQKLTREVEEKNKRLEMLATVDGLTEVYNHRYFQDFLDQEINRARRKEKDLALIMADVDHFKKFNDNHGHQTGDAILQQVCRVLEDKLRQYDVLARYGGEEFGIILPETTVAQAMKVAEKLRVSIEEHTFNMGPERFSVTLSFGVAGLAPEQNTHEKNDLISFADQALFESKKQGRNRVTEYVPKTTWFGKNWGRG